MMFKRYGLLLVGLVGLAVMLIVLVPSFSQRDAMLTETAETRSTVEDALDHWVPKQIVSAADPAVLEAARNLSNAPYVARLWIVDDTGKILYHHDGPGQQGDTVRTLAGRDGRSLVGGLSSDIFSGSQAIQIYTATALMSDGDHNDVFRPLVRPLVNAAGRMVGVIGLSYDVSPEVSAPPVGDLLITGVFLLALGVYWLSLPLWTLLDARQRGEPANLWAAFVLVANLVGLFAYLLVVNRRRNLPN